MTIADIEAIFGKDKYPENGFPGEERPSEWKYVYDRLRGKDWHDLALPDLETQGGINEGISCLSADTFVYFLPGLINLALNNTSTMSTRYVIADAIAARLTLAQYQPHATGGGYLKRRQQGRTELEVKNSLTEKEQLLALLSLRQRQFLITFLNDAAEQEPTLCRVVVNSAIHSLEQGRIEPYQYADVLSWAEQFKSI
jgi:hypothetical protein